MARITLVLFIYSLSLGVFAQTTTQDGSWQNNSNWNATYPGSGTDGDGTLNLNGETLNFNDYIILGSNVGRININVANSNFAGEFIVNDTLIIYGDVVFENKSMELTVTSNGVLIILGDLTMNNKISVDSDGVIVATGTFTMSGSGAQNDYSGTGNVYAGAYGGNAQSEIDDSGDGDGDSSFTIDELSDDGFDTIEEFVNGGGSTPLPVELLYFNVDSKNEVVLSWATATEINNHYFSIERSEDGSHFYEIGRVEGNGDSNNEIKYEFTDKFVLAPVEYYRLKQVDFDGQSEYFEVKRINTGLEDKQAQISAYPTVVRNGSIKLTSNAPFQIRQITLYSLTGGESKSMSQNTIQDNPLNYQVNTSEIQKGIYILKVVSSEGRELSTRIIVE
jgi:hypothetical protein